jgi:hypothetical protein
MSTTVQYKCKNSNICQMRQIFKHESSRIAIKKEAALRGVASFLIVLVFTYRWHQVSRHITMP